jgi:malonyl-CoA/methylmalonyl-CoA synthetase
MSNENLFALLRREYMTRADDVCIEVVDPDQKGLEYSFRAIDAGSAMLANFFESIGLKKGERILVHAEKSAEVLMVYLAALRGGWVFVPLNNAYRDELAHFFSDAQPAVVITSSANYKWVKGLAERAGVSHLYTLDNGSGTLLSLAAEHSVVHEAVRTLADDLAVIIYTSGTTGASKGAMLSHRNLMSNATTLHDLWGFQRAGGPAQDVLIHALPIYHVHGLFVACHHALLSGSRMLWMQKFEPEKVIKLFKRATVFMGVPTMYARLLSSSALNSHACSTMRLFVSGSAPLLPQVHRAFHIRTEHEIVERYGMSETGMITSNPYHFTSNATGRQAGTVGRALPGVEIRVRDDTGVPFQVHGVGEVEVKGPNVCAGYWRMSERSAEAFTADGWFRTGDVGSIDERGVLTLVGRRKDLIISGGLNVYPGEIEAVINGIPGVEESAVVGVPHADFGECVVAVVVVSAGASVVANDVSSHVKQRLASFKAPKLVSLVDALPRNAMGKVQKVLLRQQYSGAFYTPAVGMKTKGEAHVA